MKKLFIGAVILVAGYFVAGYFVAKRVVKKALNFDDLFINWDCT